MICACVMGFHSQVPTGQMMCMMFFIPRLMFHRLVRVCFRFDVFDCMLGKLTWLASVFAGHQLVLPLIGIDSALVESVSQSVGS